MARTEREQRIAKLHLSNGMLLMKHPAFTYIQNFMGVVVRDSSPFDDKGTLDRLRNRREIGSPAVNVLGATMDIEEMNALLRQSNSEVDESVQSLNRAYNKIKAMSEILVPELVTITHEIRQARMTTELEMTSTLKWLTTVREFFLENKYELEMKRLRDFIEICKEIQSLKNAGTLDAVAELAITLAVQEKKNERK